ncbi:MAG: toxin VasX [Pseudomonadota bacterium]|nr:hypothetical protein A3Q32_09550 [Alcanivorax sp. KX64203]MEC7815179.1 toxin VasX [Pseudomonadota bacterium]
MSESPKPRKVRRAPVRINPVTGNPLVQWALTPADQTDDVHVCLPDPQQALTLYPMRYGVTQDPISAEDFPDMDPSGYEGLEEGWHFGLRSLRPYTYVYLLARVEGEWRIRVWQVTEDGYFTPLGAWEDEEDIAPPWQGIPTLPKLTAALPYITAPLPTPDLAIDDTAWLLVCDSRLTRAKLDALTADTDGLRTELATEIRLTETGAQPHLGPTEALANLPEFNGDPEALAWSESTPSVLPAGQLLSLLTPDISARCGVMQQYPARVVALHDTTGVMSELGNLAGQELEVLQIYSADAARKLRVSEWIDALGERKRREVELDIFNNDPVGSALPPGASGGAANAARDRAYRAGVAAETTRLTPARNDERRQFVSEHPDVLSDLTDAVVQAAATARRVYQGLQGKHDATLALYDEQDAENFLALRRVVAFSLGVLTLDDDGVSQIAGELTETGPTGLMARALLGHPEVSGYVEWRGSAVRAGRNITGEVIERLNTVIETLPADDGSRQLSVIVGALVAKGKLSSAGQFWSSAYAPALEVLNGEAGLKQAVPLKDAGAWLLARTGGRGANGFRPVTVARAANDLVDLYETKTVPAQLDADQRQLAQRVHFWHGIRLGISGLGLWFSAQNAATAMEKFGQEDGNALVNSLNLGSAALATGAASAGGVQAVTDLARARAALASNEKLADDLAKKVNYWGNVAVGLAAGAALVAFVKEEISAVRDETGTPAALGATKGLLHLGEATLGSLHLMARVTKQAREIQAMTGVLPKGKLTRASIQITERMTSSNFRIAKGLGKVAARGHIVGWVLLASQMVITELQRRKEEAADEQKIQNWIAGSVWGEGRHDGKPVPALDEEAELKAFYRLFREPVIETDVKALKWLSSMAPFWAGYRQATTGSPYPEGVGLE